MRQTSFCRRFVTKWLYLYDSLIIVLLRKYDRCFAFAIALYIQRLRGRSSILVESFLVRNNVRVFLFLYFIGASGSLNETYSCIYYLSYTWWYFCVICWRICKSNGVYANCICKAREVWFLLSCLTRTVLRSSYLYLRVTRVESLCNGKFIINRMVLRISVSFRSFYRVVIFNKLFQVVVIIYNSQYLFLL